MIVWDSRLPIKNNLQRFNHPTHYFYYFIHGRLQIKPRSTAHASAPKNERTSNEIHGVFPRRAISVSTDQCIQQNRVLDEFRPNYERNEIKEETKQDEDASAGISAAWGKVSFSSFCCATKRRLRKKKKRHRELIVRDESILHSSARLSSFQPFDVVLLV